MAANDSTSLKILVNADVVDIDRAKTKPDFSAYVFSGAELLADAPLDEKGNATLSVPRAAPDMNLRVLVGPKVDKASATFAELIRRGAQEQHVRIGAKDAQLKIPVRIFPPIWECWIRSACFVRGTLLKRVTSGGVWIDLPVCHATVEIYEVDPFPLIIYRLPDDVLAHLREIIVRPVPHPDPGPEFARNANVARAKPQALTAAGTHRLDADAVKVLAAVAESTSLKYAAQLGSKLQFQQALIDNAAIIRSLLCLFYPRFVTMQRVGTATTDECGHFQTLFFQGCRNHDRPDLYFKAKQRLFGFFEVTIYAPTPIACHTWWNYACGTEVTLYTTSPLAVTCQPCLPVNADGNWVLFTAIGNTSLKAIFGGGASGATSGNWGLLAPGVPWGGVLRPRLDFANSVRDTLGVKYYQLSWQRGTAGDPNAWTPFNTDVNRHFAHMVGSDLVIEPYKLGPNPMVVNGKTLQLYEIPPALPPIGQWTIANAVTDTENGEFDSAQFATGLIFDHDTGTPSGTDESGLYQIKLELFDATGNLINIAAKSITYVVPDDVDLTGIVNTVHANTVAQPGGGTLVHGNALVLTLHIDNNRTWAHLGEPTTPTGTADACCGVVPYNASDSVDMPYTVYHPHGFATYGLNVFRSATTILSFSGGVGNYVISETVGSMMSINLPPECMNKPPCTLAAFSEHLDVHATATDGWGTYLGYDSVGDRAFALAPQS